VTVFVLGAAVLRLPWSIYADWARERSYGLSSQDLAGWLTQTITTTIFTSFLGGLVAIAIYALMRRTGPRWWIWSSAVCAVLAFLAVVVAPLLFLGAFNETRPAPAGPVRMAVEDVAQKAGMPASKIVVFNGSKQSNNYTASVVGGPGFATIVLSDTMLAGEVDQSEIRAVVAHEIGHYVHNHLLILVAVVAVLAGAGLWLVDRILGVVSRNRDRQAPLVQDPAAIPLAHLVFITFTLLTTPIIVSTERWVEEDADAYGLQLANEPDGAAKALIRKVDFRASSPGPIEETLFYDHPSIARRIRRAMEWKRSHPADHGDGVR
jgi:STE24 endopeptidase